VLLSSILKNYPEKLRRVRYFDKDKNEDYTFLTNNFTIPALTVADQARLYGDDLWRLRPDLCCQIRKVQPLVTMLGALDAWITGIRREQAPTRANGGVVEWDCKFGLVKVNPLARWTSADVWKYIAENDVPYNPLHDRGYPSIGCRYCTRPVDPGEPPRAGRWSGSDKTECGLHL